MHGFYEDDEDSKPDMLLTKTGLYSKADIYLNGKRQQSKCRCLVDSNRSRQFDKSRTSRCQSLFKHDRHCRIHELQDK